MPLDFTFVLWVGSLLLSAVLVGVFLWLMREDREAKGVRREANQEAEENPARSEGSPPSA